MLGDGAPGPVGVAGRVAPVCGHPTRQAVRGLCKACYARAWRAGRPPALRQPRKVRAAAGVRFWTVARLDELAMLWPVLPVPALARHFDRSSGAVIMQARNLGLVGAYDG